MSDSECPISPSSSHIIPISCNPSSCKRPRHSTYRNAIQVRSSLGMLYRYTKREWRGAQWHRRSRGSCGQRANRPVHTRDQAFYSPTHRLRRSVVLVGGGLGFVNARLFPTDPILPVALRSGLRSLSLIVQSISQHMSYYITLRKLISTSRSTLVERSHPHRFGVSFDLQQHPYCTSSSFFQS